MKDKICINMYNIIQNITIMNSLKYNVISNSILDLEIKNIQDEAVFYF